MHLGPRTIGHRPRATARRMHMPFLVALIWLLAQPTGPAERPGRKWTTVERLQLERLRTVEQARLRFSRDRQSLPRVGIYQDYRSVIRVHAVDAAHTRGTRQQVLAAAKRTGVQVVLSTDHNGPGPAAWNGIREGVMFISGAGENGALLFPEPDATQSSGPGGELKFLSHVEERLDASLSGFDGLEIYNRHTDSTDEEEAHRYLRRAGDDADEWKNLSDKTREFPDEVFAAGADYWPSILSKYDREIQSQPLAAIAANDAQQNQLYRDIFFDPYDVSFRNVSTHILAREFTEAEVRQSLRRGRTYVAHDWLCDPSGFAFLATNRLGAFEIGDRVPLAGSTELVAQTPLAAHLKLIHKGHVVAKATGDRLRLEVKEPGAYRVEAWLSVDGEERPWIYSSPIYIEAFSLESVRIPPLHFAPEVRAQKDIVYVEGKPEDADKHKLDVYSKRGLELAPVFLFIHGGSWRSQDRTLYPLLGNRFAKEGIVTVVISYRLAPQNRHPAQIEDVAAAFAWVVDHIADYGGDPERIYVGGHSAGAHLAALLALNEKFLKARGLSARSIRGVITLSGIYEVRGQESVFGQDEEAHKEASPLYHVRAGAPPFLITYCQWDYMLLPEQARLLDAALRKERVASRLVFIPELSHISEMFNIIKEDDPTARAILGFVR